jgi:putative addiction module component (TIGR02574 family)
MHAVAYAKPLRHDTLMENGKSCSGRLADGPLPGDAGRSGRYDGSHLSPIGEIEMSVDISVEHLTVPEKLALMEKLWDDLSRRPENVPSPEWHGDVLAERIAAVRDGRTDFVPWDDAKRRFRERMTENTLDI